MIAELGSAAESLTRAVIESPRGFGAWCESYGRIKHKISGRMESWELNHLQTQLAEVTAYCLANDVPIRVLILKPRQKGSSTVSTGLIKYLCERFAESVGLVMGGKLKQTESLWGYLRTFCKTDQYNWGHEQPEVGNVIRFGNGSIARKETAKDPEAGRSWALRYLLVTEAARLAEDGVANAKAVLTGAMACVPYKPNTLILLESTARGPSGVFYEKWQGGCTLEEFMADPIKHHGKFIKIFSPWYAFPDSRDELSEAHRQVLVESLKSHEVELMEEFDLELEHIAWMRRTIAEECEGEPIIFDREYPKNPTVAFRASNPSVFSSAGLVGLSNSAKQAEQDRRPVLLNQPDERLPKIVPQDCDESEAMWWIWEKPVQGRRYLMGIDFMQGLTDDERGDDRDHHAALVLRQGYFDRDRGWRPPRVVARTVWPCQWDLDLLEDELWMAHVYYGRCMLVPEINKDGGVTRNLVNRGALVYEPVKGQDSATDLSTSKKSGKYGFLVTGGGQDAERTKARIIKDLKQAVREWDQNGCGIEVDQRTHHELEVFCQLPNGKMEAINGEHDDSVMALAIGNSCLDFATVYVQPSWELGTGAAMYCDPDIREARTRRRRPAARGASI